MTSFFSPQNTEPETRHVAEKLESGLREIFRIYTPVVIGYGGNDGGFMDVLDKVLAESRGIFWCFTGTEPPKGKIRKLVVEKQGCFIPIEGFDELIVLLGQKIKIGLLHEKIEQVAKERVERYRKQVEKTIENMNNEETDILPAAWNEIIKIRKHEEADWWTYALRAMKETDPEKIESIYEEGLEKCPDSHELMTNYANFLTQIKKDYPQAEKSYLKALELAPDDADDNGNYAVFLTQIKKDYPQAEKHHLKALGLAPDNAGIHGNYALLLLQQRHFEKAKNSIDKAFQLIQSHEKSLELELWFYRYACFYQDYPESKSQVDSLLQDGVQSPGWPLEGLLETVREIVKHPEYDQVAKFAKQICEV